MKRFTINFSMALALGLGLILVLLALLSNPGTGFAMVHVAPGGSDISDCADTLSPCTTVQVDVAITSVVTPVTYLPLIFTRRALLKFAVIGDYGNDSTNEANVAALVASWNPDFVITLGDNNYPDGEAATIDDNIGQFYSAFIGNYQGAYGSGSATNRFWPSLGNHDWHTISCDSIGCSGAYFDYFTLPNNERYYDVDLGLVHLYAIDSDSDEPDGRSSTSIQANWLQSTLAISNACFDVVYFHHAAYSSALHGSKSVMQWPFEQWGAEVVLAGHDHTYERIDVSGFPYFVNGAGGAGLYNFDNIGNLPSGVVSEVRYNDEHGAMLVTATLSEINYKFITAGGVVIDDYTIQKSCG